jgi:hypothetical protein
MSYYIWLDKDSQEVKREEKGRGRVKKEAKQGQDGNWYISEGQNLPEAVKAKTEAPEAAGEATTGEAVEEAEKKPENDNVTKERKTIQKTSVSKLLKSLHSLRVEKNPEETLIKIISPVVIGGNDIDEVIVYNSAYAKIEIDTVAKSISIWTVTEKDKDGRDLKPDFVINNVIEEEKEEIKEEPVIVNQEIVNV